MQLAIEKLRRPRTAAAFSIAPNDAAPMGGLDIRRKPLQDSPTPGANSVAAMVLDRLYGLTGETLYRDWAEKTLEAFVGFRSAVWFIRRHLWTRCSSSRAPSGLQVVITGAAGDSQAAALEQAATGVYRFGKSVLRITPERSREKRSAPRAQRNHSPSSRRHGASLRLPWRHLPAANHRRNKIKSAAHRCRLNRRRARLDPCRIRASFHRAQQSGAAASPVAARFTRCDNEPPNAVRKSSEQLI